MTLAELREQLDYTEWANRRMLQAVAAVADDDLRRDLGASFPTLRDTVAHMVGAEWVWLQRWTGTSPATFPDWLPAASLAQLVEALSAIQAERAAWFASLDEEMLSRPLAFRLFNGNADAQPLQDLLLHVVNHATYHRGQVAAMLRQVGAKPISTDRITFTRERRAAQ
jgi:uncharacterized damage-inducible protein DinB